MDTIALQTPLRQHTPHPAADRPTSRPSAREVDGCARAICRGDAEAIEHFYHAKFPVAMAVAMRASRRDESFCLDVVHDATLRLLKGVKPTLTDAQLDLYLKRCVISATIDRLRRDARRRTRERARAVREPEPGPEPDRIASLRTALAQLDDLDRALLTSRFAHDATLESAGAAHGLSGPAAHGRIRRALDRLRSIIKEGEQ